MLTSISPVHFYPCFSDFCSFILNPSAMPSVVGARFISKLTNFCGRVWQLRKRDGAELVVCEPDPLDLCGTGHGVCFQCFKFEQIPLQSTEPSVCKVFSLEALLFTWTFCAGHSLGGPCHFAECQQAFTVTTLMSGGKMVLLLSSKIAPGLLVALHLKVSTLCPSLAFSVLTVIFIICIFWKLHL